MRRARKIRTIVLNRRDNTDDSIDVRLKANAVHIMDLFADRFLSWKKRAANSSLTTITFLYPVRPAHQTAVRVTMGFAGSENNRSTRSGFSRPAYLSAK